MKKQKKPDNRLGTNILERIYKPNIKGSIEEFFKALNDFILDEDEEETENN